MPRRRKRTRYTPRGGGLTRRSVKRARTNAVQGVLSLLVWLAVAAAVLFAAASCMHG